MEKDVKMGLVCLVITLFSILFITIVANVSSSDNKDSKTTKITFITKPTTIITTTTTTRINRYRNEECICNEQNKRLEKCLNELSNTTRCDTTITKEPIENNEIPDYRCQSNMDCVGHKGYTECLNGYCSCKQKKLNPDQNWRYLRFHKECVLCPDGWDADDLLNSDYCFKYFHEEKTFNESLDICKSYGAELITVDFFNEWLSYQKYLDEYRLPNERIWLGYRSSTNPKQKIEFLNVYLDEALVNDDSKWCYNAAHRSYPSGRLESCAESGVKECNRFLVAADCSNRNAFVCIKRFKKCNLNQKWYGSECVPINDISCNLRSRCNEEKGMVCNYGKCKCKRGTELRNGKCFPN